MAWKIENMLTTLVMVGKCPEIIGIISPFYSTIMVGITMGQTNRKTDIQTVKRSVEKFCVERNWD